MKKIKTKFNKLITFTILVSFLASFSFPNYTGATEYTFGSNSNQDVWQLNQDINEKRSQITELKRQIDVYNKNINAKQKSLTSLSNQLSTINNGIAKVNLEISAIELEVDTFNLKIANTELQIDAKEDEIARQKEMIAELIRSLHREQQQNDLLEILLLNENFSDFMSKLESLEKMQDNLLGGVEELQGIKIALVDDKEQLETNKQELDVLADRLLVKKESLDGQKVFKYALMQDTQGQEAKFQALLDQARDEQLQMNADIVYLEQVARQKLNRQLELQELISDGLMWPVPSRYITAYFHDPEYPYRYIFEHPAIDIRAAQGTPIRAADSGYVAKAKDGGQYGYSYIMLIHADNISTVYGHVNIISVASDQFVSKGQVIGYSGGMPGTRGAGRFTTGPHLHFEVRSNGIPVNPINYLP
ncbi:peptidoglycan DD-metalloendopeptidase family protein [bacterium]|jgi:murein DD-endopeptidase MepM/ murein hydrolase activator NlpD|nr:peptidoglycan DD-metalloendopeptidase family protein [bacterium]MBT4649255.1 peptidoglycan DD-metalloendopeptidase family protein [bacterium]